MLPQDTNSGRGRLDPVRRTHPHPEGEEEEPLHLVPPQRVHLLRERQAPRAIPTGHGPGEGLRRGLERTRPDEAVNHPPDSRFNPSPFLVLDRAAPLPPRDPFSPLPPANKLG